MAAKVKQIVLPGAFLLSLCLLASCGPSEVPDPYERVEDERALTDEQWTVNSLASTDAFGRSFSSVSTANPSKEVGIFYSLWHGSHETGIYDVTLLKEVNPDALWDVSSGNGQPTDSPLGAFHYFGRPLYGYYDSRDPWVLTRHCELFAMAGIDYIVFDTTNSVIYTDAVKALIEVFRKYAAQGFEVPKLAFYTNSHSQITVDSLYSIWYKDGLYDDVWYKIDGKPMLVTNKDEFTDYDKLDFYEEFFTLKGSQWPDERMRKENFPWMNWEWPQFNHDGIMSVSIAQMPGYNAANQEVGNFGRGYTRVTEGYKTGAQNVDEYQKGLNFEEEWRTALDPELSGGEVDNVFITQWNEWMAIKNRANNGDMQMVDGFDLVYSRDAEMTDSETGYGDGFYLQIARNLRKFAYNDGEHYFLDPHTIAIGENDKAWDEVKHSYRDFQGDAMFRNFKNAAGSPSAYGYEMYEDLTARNDIVSTKVTHDNDNIYVRVETAEELVLSSGDESWMNLFIGTPDVDGRTPFAETFDYRIMPDSTDGSSMAIARYAETESGEKSWTKTDQRAKVSFDGNVVEYQIPRSAIGVGNRVPHLLLKATDHLTDPLDIDDFYVSGDSAPIGRLAYEYAY